MRNHGSAWRPAPRGCRARHAHVARAGWRPTARRAGVCSRCDEGPGQRELLGRMRSRLPRPGGLLRYASGGDASEIRCLQDGDAGRKASAGRGVCGFWGRPIRGHRGDARGLRGDRLLRLPGDQRGGHACAHLPGVLVRRIWSDAGARGIERGLRRMAGRRRRAGRTDRTRGGRWRRRRCSRCWRGRSTRGFLYRHLRRRIKEEEGAEGAGEGEDDLEEQPPLQDLGQALEKGRRKERARLQQERHLPHLPPGALR